LDFHKKTISKEELAGVAFFFPNLTQAGLLNALGCTLEAAPEKLEPAEKLNNPAQNDEIFFVETNKNKLANMALGLLVHKCGDVIEPTVDLTTYFLMTRIRAIDTHQTIGFNCFAGRTPVKTKAFYQHTKMLTVQQAFNELLPFQKDPQMVLLAKTALDGYNDLCGFFEQLKKTDQVIKNNAVQVSTGFKVPVKMKEPRSAADLSFETLFFPGQTILAKEPNSGRWVATEYYGYSDGRFHVTNGIKVSAIAIFDKTMLGKKECPKGFRYWQLCGACLTAWRQS
jgi:hypothetical protein